MSSSPNFSLFPGVFETELLSRLSANPELRKMDSPDSKTECEELLARYPVLKFDEKSTDSLIFWNDVIGRAVSRAHVLAIVLQEAHKLIFVEAIMKDALKVYPKNKKEVFNVIGKRMKDSPFEIDWSLYALGLNSYILGGSVGGNDERVVAIYEALSGNVAKKRKFTGVRTSYRKPKTERRPKAPAKTAEQKREAVAQTANRRLESLPAFLMIPGII